MQSVDDKLKGRIEAYSRVFETRDGKIVLEDLERQFYHCPMKSGDLAREAGRRDVVLHIHRRMTNE